MDERKETESTVLDDRSIIERIPSYRKRAGDHSQKRAFRWGLMDSTVSVQAAILSGLSVAK
ncbi:hypothetical protein OAF34_00740 [Pirellulaceae bacterium]|jgi:hypothetical protein|nr:hypothetical protein [Pirellulaceae bacterium]